MSRLLDCLCTYHHPCYNTDCVLDPCNLIHIDCPRLASHKFGFQALESKGFSSNVLFCKQTGSKDQILILFTYMEAVYCPPLLDYTEFVTGNCTEGTFVFLSWHF